MRWSRWAATLAVLLVLLLPALSLRRVDIVSPPPWLPRCAFHEVTGWHCPGCGNTRAAHALLHGDLAEALRQNALSVVALPFFAVFVWRSWFGWVFPGRLRPLRFQWRQGYTVTVVAVLLLFWLLRNLPWQP
ncbi:MAG TPA: DUF2752 domain-containing protein, partial [Bacteroidia bacterium]|nr:DUF2752 domain-containing protein [Bacteroidia bacterium]